ncbi:MAG: DUF1669 domain-containing protein [Planctomycetes bacterium]|nr:DUF1669 domain-containing protein [Planctomycetota bacterium]
MNTLRPASRPLRPGGARAGAFLAAAAVLLAPAAFPASARADAEAVFTSANHGAGTTVCADKIIEVMQSAQKSISIAVAHFNSDAVTAALIGIQRDRNGDSDRTNDVKISVLLDMGEYGDRNSQSKALEAAGIEVRYKTYSLAFYHPETQLMHHKYMIVDGKDLVSGSYNWSDTAEQTNYENIIHFKGPDVKTKVRAFQKEFDKLWGMNRNRYPAFMEALRARPGSPAYRKVIPIHFNQPYYNGPMALTRSEVAAMRSAAAAAGLRAGDAAVKPKRFFDRERKVASSDPPAGTFLPAAADGGSGELPSGTPNGPGFLDRLNGEEEADEGAGGGGR